MSYVSTLTLESPLSDVIAERDKCLAELTLATSIQEQSDIEYHLDYLAHVIREETLVVTGYYHFYNKDEDDYDMVIDDEDFVI